MNAQTKTAAKAAEPQSDPEVRMEIVSKLAYALSQAQAEFLPVLKDKTAKAGTYSYDYADLADVIEAVKIPLSKNGLAHSARTLFRDGSFLLITELLHVSGESKEAEWPLPVGKPQDMGSAMTYGRRYTLQAVLGIAAEADDDGQAGGNAQVPAPKKDVAANGSGQKQEQHKSQSQQSKPAQQKSNSGPTFTLFLPDGEFHTFALGGEYLTGIEAAFAKAEDKIAFWDANSKEFQGWQTKLVQLGNNQKAIADFGRVGKEIVDTVFLLTQQQGG
jgi:hypothetical protein